MAENDTDRGLLVRSRLVDGYQVSEMGMKSIQHALTDWLPRALYADLTPDTVSVDVEVSKDYLSGKSIFEVKFKRNSGDIIKNAQYSADRIIGKTCAYYDAKKASYAGKKDGYDCRLVYYSATPISN